MPNPLVSIVTPCTRPQFISRAVCSVLHQTYQNLEMVVVNDGGEDIQLQLEKFQDPRIHYFYHEQRRGRSAARNTALNHARGKYIAYLDDDDYYYPDHLETLVKFLESSDYKVAYTDGYQTFEFKDKDCWKIYRRDLIYSNDFDLNKLLVDSIFDTNGLMHERICLWESGNFDESLLLREDWDLWLRIALHYPFCHIPKVTHEYSTRLGGDNVRLSWLGEALSAYQLVCYRYQAYANREVLKRQKSHINHWFEVSTTQLLSYPSQRFQGAKYGQIILSLVEHSWLLRSQENLARSQRLAEIFLDRVPNSSIVWRALAKCLRFQAKAEQALVAIQRSLALEQSQESLSEEMWILKALGDHDRANEREISLKPHVSNDHVSNDHVPNDHLPNDGLAPEFPQAISPQYTQLPEHLYDQSLDLTTDLPTQPNLNCKIKGQESPRVPFIWLKDPKVREIVDLLDPLSHLYPLLCVEYNTLVYPLFDRPIVLFLHVGEELDKKGLLRDGMTPKAFASLRLQVETHLRSEGRSPIETLNLSIIYGHLKSYITDTAQAISIEIAQEAQYSYLNPCVFNLLRHVKQLGLQVAIIAFDHHSADHSWHVLNLKNPDSATIVNSVVQAHQDNWCEQISACAKALHIKSSPSSRILYLGSTLNANDRTLQTRILSSPLNQSFDIFNDDNEQIRPYFERIMTDETIFSPTFPLPSLSSLRILSTKLEGHFCRQKIYYLLGSFLVGPVVTQFIYWCVGHLYEAGIENVWVYPQKSLLEEALQEHLILSDYPGQLQTAFSDVDPNSVKCAVILYTYDRSLLSVDLVEWIDRSSNLQIIAFLGPDGFEKDQLTQADRTLAYCDRLSMSARETDALKQAHWLNHVLTRCPEPFQTQVDLPISPDLNEISLMREGILTFQQLQLTYLTPNLTDYQNELDAQAAMILSRLLLLPDSVEIKHWNLLNTLRVSEQHDRSEQGDRPESMSHDRAPLILICSTDPGVGGVYQHNHTLILALRHAGYLVASLQPPPLELELIQDILTQQRDLGVQHYWLHNSATQVLQKFLLRINPNLIIFSNSEPVANFSLKTIACKENIPFVLIEGLVDPKSVSQYASELVKPLNQHYQAAREIITVSNHNLQLLQRYFDLPFYKGTVIYNGRPGLYFQDRNPLNRKQLRADLQIPEDAIVCFTAARIEHRKGYPYQLEAIRQLRHDPTWKRVYFVWAGAGIFAPDLEHHLKTEVKQLDIAHKVKFIGQVPSVVDWLDIADIFILPSEAEGMPLSVMEAMAKGLAVIATAVGGTPEALGETGQLLPDPNLDAHATVQTLVATLQTWLRDPARILTLGQACQDRAFQLFQEERMIKESLNVVERALLPNNDYVAPGFKVIQPDSYFPNMTIADPMDCVWPYLRREIPHSFYVDRRLPTIGFLNRDEAHIIYNTALQFQGKRALEIGCWLGWSACHLALAGLSVDVIDPLLIQLVEEQDVVDPLAQILVHVNLNAYASITDSLEAAGVRDRVNLLGGYSPEAVRVLAEHENRSWPLIFIDGNHNAPGPQQDAVVCAQYAAPDAIILFHDLNAPDVAEGLDYLRDQGWQTLIYQTMQIMGVAWRGNVQPVNHIPDPRVAWTLPEHLKGYAISGWKDYQQVRASAVEKLPRICIDAVFFQLFKTGIARVWRSLLEEWQDTDFAQHVIVLDRADTAPKIPGLRYRTIDAFNYDHLDHDRELLQHICDAENADLFISTYYTTPLTTPSVLLIHDLIPELFGQDLNHPFWRGKPHAIEYASHFICVSQNTAKDLQHCYPNIPSDRITVAYNGVSSCFTPATPAEIKDFRVRYGITKPYFLVASAIQGYKNVILFYKAFAQLCSARGFDIVCTGGATQLDPIFRDYTANVTVYLLYLSDVELKAAYSGAVALVYPSEYEGFGLPIVEAMACGCPVITCPNASIPEVAGEAALYVSAHDGDAMADALCDIQKPSIRNSLVPAGITQAQTFSWTRMATTIADTLIAATLLPLNLCEINLIAFPIWDQPEADLQADLMAALGQMINYALNLDQSSEQLQINLLLDISDNPTLDLDLLINSVSLELMMAEDVEIPDGILISPLPALSSAQWSALLPRLTARIPLVKENNTRIAKYCPALMCLD